MVLDKQKLMTTIEALYNAGLFKNLKKQDLNDILKEKDFDTFFTRLIQETGLKSLFDLYNEFKAKSEENETLDEGNEFQAVAEHYAEILRR